MNLKTLGIIGAVVLLSVVGVVKCASDAWNNSVKTKLDESLDKASEESQEKVDDILQDADERQDDLIVENDQENLEMKNRLQKTLERLAELEQNSTVDQPVSYDTKTELLAQSINEELANLYKEDQTA